MTQEPNAMTCPECAALVTDAGAHQEWHAKLLRHITSRAEQAGKAAIRDTGFGQRF